MNLPVEDVYQLARFSLDHSGEAMLWMNTDGQILYANTAAARTLQESVENLLKKTLFQLSPELNQDLWKGLWKEIRSRDSFAFEFALLAAENKTIAVEIVMHRVEVGSQEFATVAFQDIEERKRLKTLEQGFVSTVSHELRTPLTVIREGVAQVIDGIRGDINDLQRRALTIALSGIDRLSRLVEELLDLSKMDSGKVHWTLERIDMAALVREVSVHFQSVADERKIDLRLDLPEKPCVTYAGRDRLIQVLTNLVNNAFKFTDQGQVEIKISSTPEMITCEVRDTGLGFAPEQAERIFNRFEQLDTLPFTDEKGSGLGLSICKGIMDWHRGHIWAESRGPKRGSRFIFELPRRDARTAFREQLTPLLEEIRQRGASLSAVHFALETRGDSLASSSASLLIDRLENLVQQERGRHSEILIKDTHTLDTAFPSTVAKEAIRIADHIQAAFHDSLSPEEGAALRLTYTVTSFPEPFGDSETFLQRAVPLA